MTRRTGLDHPRACPVGDSLAVRTAHPIFFLSEVALTAHLIAVIHICFRSFFGHQKIAVILFVTGIAG
jgi:hypothetical protein